MRKTIKSYMLLLGLCVATLSSFSPMPGGEGFEIYLNNKLVLQKFNADMKKIPVLQLDKRNANDQLSVKYHHCGKIGKDRVITVKDEKNKILRQWRFADVSTVMGAMTCNVKEILSLEKLSANQLKLYYASTELPEGRQLVTIEFAEKSYAVR